MSESGDLVLGLDGALGPFSAALVARGSDSFERSAVAGPNAALETGLGVVEAVLAGTDPAALGSIAVSTGPG